MPLRGGSGGACGGGGLCGSRDVGGEEGCPAPESPD